MNYMREPESDIRYGYYVIKPGVFHGGFDPKRDYLAGKSETAAILVSNCVPARMRWVSRLSKYIDVKVYGRCGHNRCPNSAECIQKHKFYLAFENSFCRDYVTEKFYANALGNGVIPVVLTDANFSDPTVVPPRSVINALDFPSVKKLAEYMIKVGSNSSLYNEYFRWHSKYTVVFEDPNRRWCALCLKLATDSPVKVYKDIARWYSSGRLCLPYPVPK